jgi:hypothetical protein
MWTMDVQATQPRITTRRPRRYAVAAVVVAVAVVAAAAVGWARRDDLFGEAIDPGTPLPASAELTVAETEFYGFVAPRLRALAGESQKLAELGRAKSRNLIELQRRGDRIDDVSKQVDDYVAVHAVPERFAAAYRQYEVGIEAVRRAKSESRAAFASFDWDRVARAVEAMETGAADLATAAQELEQVAGQTTSAQPTAESS